MEIVFREVIWHFRTKPFVRVLGRFLAFFLGGPSLLGANFGQLFDQSETGS